MNRCTRTGVGIALSAALTGLSFTLAPLAATAQGIIREAPKDVKAAMMVVTAPPEITIDGKADRLSPGSRIRDLNNMLVLSGGIVNKSLPVVYRRDSAGLVHEIWVLTPQEYARLGGADGSTADGYKRFAELLALIFGMRK